MKRWLLLGLLPFLMGVGGLPLHNPVPPPVAGCVPVLDGISITPTFAFSSRRLLSSYHGPALRAYRSSDGAEQDIGFNNNCDLATAALLAFCAPAPGTCFEATWYDQSGNHHDVSPIGGVAGTSPALVAGGALSATINGHLAVKGGSANFLQESSPVTGLIGTTAGSIFVVANATSAGASSSTASWWASSGPLVVSSADSNGKSAGIVVYQTGSSYSPPSVVPFRYLGTWIGAHTDMPVSKSYVFGTDAIMALRYNTSDMVKTKGYLDGGTPATDSSTSANNADAQMYVLGCVCGNASTPFNGKVGEAIGFATELSLTDANHIGHNDATWWGLAWTTITQ